MAGLKPCPTKAALAACGKPLRGDVGMGGVPDAASLPDDERLRRLVPHTESIGHGV